MSSHRSAIVSDGVHLTINECHPNSQMARELWEALDKDLLTRYPALAIHGFHSGELTEWKGLFVVGSFAMNSVACGAMRILNECEGEIKRMYVSPGYRKLGIGRVILDFLEVSAWNKGIRRLRLETGTAQPEAIGLYESAGYNHIEPYGEYVGNVHSVCFEKILGAGEAHRS